MQEFFKDVPGCEGIYQVSDQGRVKSLKFGKERILKSSIDTRGYNKVGLYINNKKKVVNIYKLVAIAFLGHKPDGHSIIVDHKYPPKTDDRLLNLQLITNRENLSKDKWRKKPSSNYVGVSWCKITKKWAARIYINKKNIYLGRFDTEIEAYNVYQEALKKIIENN